MTLYPDKLTNDIKPLVKYLFKVVINTLGIISMTPTSVYLIKVNIRNKRIM